MQLPRFGRGVWAPGVFCAAMVLGRTAAAQGDDPPSLEEPSGALTLEQAVALAIERGPELRAAELGLAVAEGQRLQAGLRPNPEAAYRFCPADLVAVMGNPEQLAAFQQLVEAVVV